MFDIYCMEMGGKTTLPAHTKFTRYNNTHLATIKRIVQKAKTEYVWIVSDLCDYTNFDFTWQPVLWESEQVHCWASGNQKHGDTFLIPVRAFKSQADSLKVLGWYKHINYHSDGVKRITLGNMYDWVHYSNARFDYDPNLWEKRNLHAFGTNGSVLLVPRDCKSHFSSQYYDYPYILRHTDWNVNEKPQDVVFISYDEKNADLNYDILKKYCPRAKRLHGVEGQLNALREAARISDTDHYFAVFAKTKINPDFKFDFLPDRLRVSSHYIFNAKNMSNDLEYGTMGVILYNCRLLLDADEDKFGVDFTTSFPLQVVPELSAYAYFAEDEYRAWRTAFRECTKLQSRCIPGQIDVETHYRLNIWCTKAHGDYSEWVLKGANDGVEFAKTTDNLKQVNDWDWLRNRFDSIYN